MFISKTWISATKNIFCDILICMQTRSKEEIIAISIAVGIAFIFMVATVPVVGNVDTTVTTRKVSTNSTQTTKKNTSPLVRIGQQQVETTDFVTGNSADAVRYGDTVFVHYVATTEKGKVFDTTTQSAIPVEATIGSGQVLTGWEIGMLGMRENGTREIQIPSSLAYGNTIIEDEQGNVLIPANTPLVYDVVLLKIKKGIQ